MRYIIEDLNHISKEELFQGYERIIYDENGNLIAKLRPGQLEFECTNILKESKFDDYIKSLDQNKTSIYDIIRSELESKKSRNDIIQQVINIIDKYDLNVDDIMNYFMNNEDDSLDKYQPIKQLKVNINKYLSKIKKSEKNKEYEKSIVNYFLVISNNKKDLLGASDDRGWTSCIGPEGIYWKYHELSYPNSFIVYIINKIEKNGNKCKLKIRPDGSLDNVVGRKVIRQIHHGQKYGWCSREPFYPVDMDTKFDKMFSSIISKFIKTELCFGEPVGVGYCDFMKYGPYINVPANEIDEYINKIGKLKNGRVIYELIRKQHRAGIPINPELKEQLIEGGLNNIDYMFLYLMEIDHKDEEIKNIIIQYANAELLYDYLSSYEDKMMEDELCSRDDISYRFYCALLEYMKYDKEDKIKQIRKELLNSYDCENAKYLYNYLLEIEDDEIEQKLMEFEETQYPYEFINNMIKDPKLKEQYKNKLKQQVLNHRDPQSALYYLQYFDSTNEEIINILLNSDDFYIIGEYININPEFINSERFMKFRKHILEQNDPDHAFLYLYHINKADKDMERIIRESGNAELIFMYLANINKENEKMKQALINTEDAEYLFHYLVHVNRYDKEVINTLINTNNIHYIFLYLISSVSSATINTQVLNALLNSNNTEYIKNYRDYLWDYLKDHQDDRNYKKKEKIISKLNKKLRALSESVIYNITNTIKSIIKSN